MSVLPITLYGDEILMKKAVPVQSVDAKLLEFIEDMFETMIKADGVGLAANQVGSNKSIFVIDLSEVKDYEEIGQMVFINSKITKRSAEKVIMEEGCLSLPALREEVERPKVITITYQDISMTKHELEADGFLARVIQHEYDHLQGVYFTDRIDDLKKKDVKDYLLKIKNREIKCPYPVSNKEPSKKKGAK